MVLEKKCTKKKIISSLPPDFVFKMLHETDIFLRVALETCEAVSTDHPP